MKRGIYGKCKHLAFLTLKKRKVQTFVEYSIKNADIYQI